MFSTSVNAPITITDTNTGNLSLPMIAIPGKYLSQYIESWIITRSYKITRVPYMGVVVGSRIYWFLTSVYRISELEHTGEGSFSNWGASTMRVHVVTV